MKLGQKVKCSGYLKKIKGLDYIYANKIHFDRENKINDYMLDEPRIYLENIDDGEYKQKTMELIHKEFRAVAVEKKTVSTENFYSQVTESIYDPVTFGYIDERLLDKVKVEKINYIECYKVYYAMGKSRLVPIDLVEEILC